MAYIYKHIRVDTNEVFYIGIGNQDKFKRAFVTQKRSKFWKNITSKTEYTVEIIKDGLTWEEAQAEEIRLIKQYGRKDLGLGTLVNLTDGGEGTIGIIHTNQWYQNQKISNNKKNKFISEEHRQKIIANHKSKNPLNNKAIDVFDMNWNYIKSFDSIKEASDELNIPSSSICECAKGKIKSALKHRFKYKLIE